MGVDVDRSKVDALNGGDCPIDEPKLRETIRANRHRLHGTMDHSDAVRGSDISFVVVPTPSDSSGAFSLKFVLQAMKELGNAMKGKTSRHMIVLTSTVMPGSMAGSVQPALETASGMKCPDDFGLCYNPEFIALGDVIRGMLKPDMILIGESDSTSGKELERVQKAVCTNSPVIARMNFINAELAKLSVNSFVTMKMSFANTIAEVCERLPGGNVDQVTQAIGNDKRIGLSYLKGATGYGGPCFPRDNIALSRLAEQLGIRALLAKSTHEVNQHQAERLVDLARKAGMRPEMDTCVLGLSYKPNTNVIEESQGMILCHTLSNGGTPLHVYDPKAMESARLSLSNSTSFHLSAQQAVAAAEVCFIMTPCKEFKQIPPSAFAQKILIDCWRVLPAAKETARAYVGVGLSSLENSVTFPWTEKVSLLHN